MTIPIKCRLREYFKIYLTVLNPVLKLKGREIEVLASFLLLTYTNKKMDPDKLAPLLFSTKVRKTIREKIGMSEASFNNHLTSLRKKGFIEKRRIHPLLLKGFPDNNPMSINFDITLLK